MKITTSNALRQSVDGAVCAALIALPATTVATFAQAPDPSQKGTIGSNAPADVVKDLAPTGKLRAAINLGNIVLAQGTPQEPRGVTVDLARELAKRLGVPLEMTTYDAAGKVFEALKAGSWDIAFLAIEPVRAAEIAFTPPSLLAEATHGGAGDSARKPPADVDRSGVRIAVAKGSAYDLYLTRTLKNATLVRFQNGPEAMDAFVRDKLEVAAGVK